MSTHLNGRRNHASSICEALRWAVEDSCDASAASADWLARDLDHTHASAIEMLTDRNTPLRTLRRAKAAYKTMRIIGETAADRRLGARLYLAAIAAAYVHHDVRISTQSDEALRRALKALERDLTLNAYLRDLATRALRALPAGSGPRHNGHPRTKEPHRRGT